MLCTQRPRPTTKNHTMISQHFANWTPQNTTNTRTPPTTLLVAWTCHLCQELRGRLCSLPTTQDQPSPKQTGPITCQSRRAPPLFPPHDGLHHRPSTLERVQFNHGHVRPWIFEGGNSRTLPQNHHGRRNRRNSTTNRLQKIWTA